MQQIYRTTPMPKCDFNKVALVAASGHNNNLTQNQNEFQATARNLLGNSSAYIRFFHETIP